MAAHIRAPNYVSIKKYMFLQKAAYSGSVVSARN